MFILFISQTEHFSEIKKYMFEQNFNSVRIINLIGIYFHTQTIKMLCFVCRGSGTKGKNKPMSNQDFDLNFSKSHKSPFVTTWTIV